MTIAERTNPHTSRKYYLEHRPPTVSAFSRQPIAESWYVIFYEISGASNGRGFSNPTQAQELFNLWTTRES